MWGLPEHPSQLTRSLSAFPRLQIVYEGPELNHAFGLCHYSSFLFWTEYRSGSIYRLDQASKVVSLLRNERPPIFEIRMYDAQQQQGAGATSARHRGDPSCMREWGSWKRDGTGDQGLRNCPAFLLAISLPVCPSPRSLSFSP